MVHMTVGNMVTSKAYSIGICVRYDNGTYILAFIRFKKNGDVVISQPVGEYQKLKDGKKFDPHVTYHGSQGIHHVVSYGRHYLRKNKQPLASFSGRESLILQAFGRNSAWAFGQVCKGFDTCVVFDAVDIELREELIQDHLGEIRTELPTACFQVDLIEPGRTDLIQNAITGTRKIIK